MSKKNGATGHEISPEEEQAKINELRQTLGTLTGKLLLFCSDDCLSRYLRAQNWNVKKASKMLKETIRWRLQYKPEEIKWEDVAHEAETGKIYRANYVDKYGRTVLVMRPGCQNTRSTQGQIKYLVYCMENAILNLTETQEQMVWLVDFKGWASASISVKVTRETAHVLQNHYPERLGLAILFNPPRIFESFWKVVKPFLEAKTAQKVKFVYSQDSSRVFAELFDMEKLESAFGGRNPCEFDFSEYGEHMKEDDKKMITYWNASVSLDSSSNLAENGHPSVLSNLVSASSSSDEDENIDTINDESRSPDMPNISEDSATGNTSPDIPEKVGISSMVKSTIASSV